MIYKLSEVIHCWLCCKASYTACLSAGENSTEIKTDADRNDITETVNPLHDKPSTGMFGFL